MSKNPFSKIITRLNKQEKEEGKLPLLLEFYKKLLQVQSKAQPGETHIPALSKETVQKRLEEGRPLLRFDDLDLDWPSVQETFAKVTTVFARYPQLFGELPEKLEKPGTGGTLTKKAAEAWFDGKELPGSLREGAGENLLQVIIQSAMLPFLSACARALIGSIDQQLWRRSYCPVCGGRPDLAYLEKEYGARWLLCSRCDSEWLFQRLQCPFCGTKNQDDLNYLSDDEGKHRLYTCGNCQNYLKAIDLRKTGDEDVLLPLQRLLTLDMDRQAQESGLSEDRA